MGARVGIPQRFGALPCRVCEDDFGVAGAGGAVGAISLEHYQPRRESGGQDARPQVRGAVGVPVRWWEWFTPQRPVPETCELPKPPPHEPDYHALANRVTDLRLRVQLQERREQRAREAWGEE